eukprot:5156034-Pleurochrysis_carterae.AAC.7
MACNRALSRLERFFFVDHHAALLERVDHAAAFERASRRSRRARASQIPIKHIADPTLHSMPAVTMRLLTQLLRPSVV